MTEKSNSNTQATQTVDILIPTRNRANWLKDAIESCLMQDYPVNIIVSDNASTDNTEELVKKYPVTYHKNEVDQGVRSNWIGLLYKYSKADYCKILADDDYLSNKSHITEAMQLIKKHNLDIVFSAETIKENDAFEHVDFELPEYISKECWQSNFLRKHGKYRIFPNLISASVFNRQKAIELRAFMDDSFGMDYDLAERFANNARAGYLRGHQVIERKHPNNDGTISGVTFKLHGLKYHSQRTKIWIIKSFVLPNINNLAGWAELFRADRIAALQSIFSLRMLKLIWLKIFNKR
jgi:glycosyltransferase involved in cell wall biosynthesis